MRRIFLAFSAALTFLFISCAFADSTNQPNQTNSPNLNNYYSTKHPKPAAAAKVNAATPAAPQTPNAPMKASFSPTNITLINATTDIVYAMVPGSVVYDGFLPRTNMHIYNDYSYSDTHLILKDPYLASFYDDYVCRRAIITIYGQPGYYSLLIDREFC